MSLEEQRAEMRRKAQEALKRTDIDAMMGLGNCLRKAAVPPAAFNLSSGATDEAKIVARSGDLLDVAIWAWYELRGGQS